MRLLIKPTLVLALSALVGVSTASPFAAVFADELEPAPISFDFAAVKLTTTEWGEGEFVIALPGSDSTNAIVGFLQKHPF